MVSKSVSPCLYCARVACPEACENKTCKEWKQWFLSRWALIYGYGQAHRKTKEENK